MLCINFKTFIFVTFAFAVTASCQPDKQIADNAEINLDGQSFSNQGYVHNKYNQIALFLAGKKTSLFSNIQNKKYYQDYKSGLAKSWSIVTAKNLKKIDEWNNKYPFVKTDTLPLLYPFSGPDFLYANAFFPNAENYILIGLEKIGKLPNISSMSKSQLIDYLQKLYGSLRYANKAAYFMTKHMQEDFSSPQLNGVIHLICMYLAKTNYQIIDISPIQINNFGIVEEQGSSDSTNEFIAGVKLNVLSPTGKAKNLYYLSVDLANSNIKNNIGLTSFLSKMGKKNAFIKSASYLLHVKGFSIMRDLILKQSETIIQDDTGIPFSVLKASGFVTKIFGTYTRTIKIFENYFQKDLHEALENERVAHLPFKLGYNSWKDEMVLILAVTGGKKITKPITYRVQKEGVIFKVQIKASWHKIPPSDEIFKELPPVQCYKNDNMYKYTIGNFSDYEACGDYVRKARNNGFEGAFVVAFYKQNRISLAKAKEIINSQK